MLEKIYLAPDAEAVDYTFDSALIDFNSTNPKLKPNRPDSLLVFSHFDENNADLKYSRDGGVLTGTAHGGAGILNDELILDPGHYVEYAGLDNLSALVQQGTIELNRTPNYSGSPSALLVMFSMLKTSGDFTNLIELRHDTNGLIMLYMYSSAQTAIYAGSVGAWSPVSGQKYRMSLNFNLTSGAIRLFIDGVQLGATITATGTRDANTGLFFLGKAWDSSLNDDSLLDDFEIYDTVQHTANYTPEAFTEYVSSSPSIQAATLNASSIVSLSINSSKPSGTDVRFTIKVSGVEYWFDGSAWVESTGSDDSNDEVTDEQFALLDIGGLSAVAVVVYLISDGEDTPILFSYTLRYLGYGLAVITGYFIKADGSLPTSGMVRARPVSLRTPLLTNEQIGISKLSSGVGALGIWSLTLISGITYRFSFESMQDSRRIKDGIIEIAVPDAGEIQFNDLINNDL